MKVIALLNQRWLCLFFLLVVLPWGCAGNTESWTVKGTTERGHAASQSPTTGLTVREDYPLSQFNMPHPRHELESPLSNAFPSIRPSKTLSVLPWGLGELPPFSSALDSQKTDHAIIQQRRDHQDDALLMFDHERRLRPEMSDNFQFAPKQDQDFQVLQYDSEQLTGTVGSELHDTGPPSKSKEASDEKWVSVHGFTEEITRTETSIDYEISQVPFPGIEAIAVPGELNENDMAVEPADSNVEQKDRSLSKVEKITERLVDDRSLQDSAVRDEDKPLSPNSIGVKGQEVTEARHGGNIHVPLPTSPLPQLPDDSLELRDMLQGKRSVHAPKLVEKSISPQPQSLSRAKTTQEVVVHKESPLSGDARMGLRKSEEQEPLSVLVEADDERLAMEDTGQIGSNATGNSVSHKKAADVQAEKLTDHLESEAIAVLEEEVKTNEKPQTKKETASNIRVDKNPRHALAEPQLPSFRQSSTVMNEPEKSVRMKADDTVSVTEQRQDTCRQDHASLTRYQSQEVLASLSRKIQTLKSPDLLMNRSQELSECYRQRAFIYFQLNEPRQAILNIDQVLQKSQSGSILRPSDLLFRSRVYASMKNASQQVIDDLSEALQLGLDGMSKAHAYYLRGLSYLRHQQFDAGLKDLSLSCRDGFPKACALLEKIM